MKKKIVYIAQSDGGVAEYLYMFLKNLKRNEYENILVVSENYKKQIDRFKNLAKKIYFIPMIREINLKSDFKAVKQIRKILSYEKPNIVYLHSSKAGALGRIALWFNRKVKVLYNPHGWYFNAKLSNKKKKIFILIEKILAIRSNMIINISKNEYDSAIKYRIAKANKMCIIENGIDFEKFNNLEEIRQQTRKKYELKSKDILIGVVGRISEQKDPMTAIKAFKLIHNENRNTKLMYIGDGDLKNDVIEYINSNNLEENVIITGWVNNVEKYIPALDIAILPSKWEGFGLVLIEYMACNKPIVATKVGGIADIIEDKQNGYLVDIEDYQMLSKKILELINNKELCNKIVEHNQKYRKKYDIKFLIEKHEEIFRKVFNNE